MSKQTAVEFLINEIDMQFPHINIRWKQVMIEKASELFEQQIKDAYVDGFKECEKIHEEAFFIQDLSEQYYNKKYKPSA
jgi:hypothetical protein